MKTENFLKYLWLWLILMVVSFWALIYYWYIFGGNFQTTQTINQVQAMVDSSSSSVSFLAAGDIMLSRVVAQKIKKFGPEFPFIKLEKIFKTNDFNFANLETPLVNGPMVPTGSMVFRADPELATTLAANNFKVLSLANNHLPNYGETGIQSTLSSLDQVSILGVGAGKQTEAYSPQYIDVSGRKIAFIAQNSASVVPQSYLATNKRFGTALINLSLLKSSIKQAKIQGADLVIVSMHAGSEYQPQPNQEQISFAHTAIEAGADLVIGHHPHVVQTVEEYQGKLIFYSLGNLIFDQMWSEETKQGLLAGFNFERNKLNKIILYPVIIENFGQPRLATRSEGERIIKRLELPPSDLFQIYNADNVNK